MFAIADLMTSDIRKTRSGNTGVKRCVAAILAAVFLAAPASEAAKVKTLIAERAEEQYGVGLPANSYFDVHLAEDQTEQGAYLREFWTDQNTGKFIANVVTKDGQLKRVWGIAVLTVPVPVPTRRILPDEIISDNDFMIVPLPWARLSSFAITDPDKLDGMQVRRVLLPGRPVPQQSIIPPTIISRGELVKIELVYGALHLMAKGKAMSDAHLGQEIRVVNLSSNKTITAIAKADGLVEALQ